MLVTYREIGAQSYGSVCETSTDRQTDEGFYYSSFFLMKEVLEK
jgi:hypothetical protein